MFSRLKLRYDKFQSGREVKRIEREKQRKIKARNQKILKIAKIVSMLICACLFGYFFFKNPDGFKSFVEQNFILLLIPIWIYLIILLIFESIRAVFEIFILGMCFAFFGVFAFLIVGVITFVIEELLIDVGSELISELFF